MKKIMVFMVLCYFIPGAALNGDVSIYIQERDGIARNSEPVTFGIPFAKGELKTSTPKRIVNPQGNTVDTQFRTMALWEDGSIKWLKCDFQADVSANTTATYKLKTGSSHTPSTELTVSETGSAITVTTGPLRFVVSKTAFNIVHQAFLDLDGNRQYTSDEEIISAGSSAGPVVTSGVTSYNASSHTPEVIEIEEQGPMKVVIKVSGRHYNGSDYHLKYETRIYAYAGKSYIKLWHVYANGKTVESLGFPLDPANDASFDRYGLDFRVNLSSSKTAFFGNDSGGSVSVALSSGQSASLLQKDRTGTHEALYYSIKRDDTLMASGSRAPGWGSIVDGKWGMTVASRYFWQKYPKGLVFKYDGSVCIEPSPTPERLYVGMGTGDEILLYFHDAGAVSRSDSASKAVSTPQSVALTAAPLLPRAAAGQFVKSKAFYNLREGQPPYAQMDNYVNTVTTNHLQNVPGLGVYGNINFGDTPVDYWYFDTGNVDATAWGSNYYDCNVLTPVRLFAQEGDLRYSDIFIPGARHFMETACWNPYDTTDWLSGFCPAYSGYHRSSSHFEQHYAEGLWYYYYLTGDERAREICLRAANAIKDKQWWGNLNVGCRMAYQRGSAVLEAWKNTRDPAYLDHAKHLLVTRLLSTQDKYGLIGSIDEYDNVTGEQTFMIGLYSDTLWKYIRELAPGSAERTNLSNKLAKMADCIDTYARKSPGEEEYWNFFNAPSNSSPPVVEKDENNSDATLYWWGKGLVAGLYAYAYDLTGNAKYKTLATSLLNNMWTAGVVDWGGSDFWEKPSGQVMKNVIHAVAIINAAPSNGLHVSSPNGGESFAVGSSQTISWTSSGSISNVKIELSVDNGGNWSTITASTVNDGSHTWTVPDSVSTGCLIRISDTGNTVSDNSNAVFSIVDGGGTGGTVSVNRSNLNFKSIFSGPVTGPQTFLITTGSPTVAWTVSDNQAWLDCIPVSGTGSGTVTVTVNPSGLATGNFNGTVSVTPTRGGGSPAMVGVQLINRESPDDQPPFGFFATPENNTQVEGSIAVTGWVLDDMQVESVKIYNGQDFIGDAVFVEGSRPDIETSYPAYPFHYKAGWGYMLLTNFLSNQGNGSYTLNIVARDITGNQVTIGTKTIVCDNANAVKPFGAIDTPSQGGNATGKAFLNWGWALTPQPSAINTDGSTITVWIDGVPVGNPVYNLARSDIQTLFPGYANTDGAVGYLPSIPRNIPTAFIPLPGALPITTG